MAGFYTIFLIVFLCVIISVNVLCIDPKIIGGFEASREQIPYQVSLKLDSKHICGGTIINPRHIITAGSCVVSEKNKLVSVKKLKVDVGTTLYTGEGGVAHTVEKIDLPKSFNLTPPIKSNMAILRIKGKFSFNQYVKPANLPQNGYISGTYCTISGWGRINRENHEMPNNLHYAVVQIIGPNCQPAMPMGTDMFCAGHLTGAVDRCEGDTGGPLVCGNHTLTGVISHGNNCGLQNYPGIYTDVQKHYDWILNILKSSSTVNVSFAPLTFTIIIFNLCK